MLLTPGILPYALALAGACADSTASLGAREDPQVFLVDRAPSLRDMYAGGKTFQQFLAAADSKREQWLANYRTGRVSPSLVARASSIAGNWRLLVIAEDWCGDSVNTIPYIARLVEEVPALEMRIISSKRGRTVMKAHRTPDDRAATPTVILLDDRYREAGCWVERPSELQRWFQENKKVLGEKELHDRKYAWYANDKGEQTVREIVEMTLSAAAGRSWCGGKA